MEKAESGYEMQDKLSDRKEMLLGELLALMERQVQLYDSLRRALSDEKDRIISVDHNGVNETGQRKLALLGKIRRLEEDRIRLVEDLSEILKIPSQGLTVNNLMLYARGSQKDRLEKFREALLDLAGGIRRMNHFNKLMLRHSLELITGSYSFLSHLAAPDTVYHSSGGLRLRHQSGKFISGDI